MAQYGKSGGAGGTGAGAAGGWLLALGFLLHTSHGQPQLGTPWPPLREGQRGRPRVADGTLGWRGPWLKIKTGSSLQYLSWEQEGPSLFSLWEALGNGDAGVERPGRAGPRGGVGSRGSPHSERGMRWHWQRGWDGDKTQGRGSHQRVHHAVRTWLLPSHALRSVLPLKWRRWHLPLSHGCFKDKCIRYIRH